MSLVLQPQSEFAIVRQIANHLDTGTYYVRAVIRYAYTDELIGRVALSLKGEQRYANNFRMPADTSGQGYYVSIVTSVYTDSDFTTKSENYGDEENTYLVQERVLNTLRGGGGLDSRTTRRIIAEELEKIKFPEQEKITIPKQKEYDNKFNEISKELTSIKDLVGALPTQNSDLRPVMTRLNELAQEVKTKPVTPETDLTPVVEKIDEMVDDNDLNRKEIIQLLNILEERLNTTMKQMVGEAVTEATPSAMKGASFSVPIQLNPPTKEQPKKQELNINNLAR